MEESGSHQPTVGPQQDNDNLHQAASGGSQHTYSGVHPQQRGGREQSGQTVHTNKSQSRGRSHVSHAENEKDMQHEIDELKRSYAARGVNGHHLSLSFLLGIQKMIHTGKDLKLHLMKPFPVMKNTVIIEGRAKVPCIRAWETEL